MNMQPQARLSSRSAAASFAATEPPAPADHIPSSADFQRLLSQFQPIALAQMDAVALLDRTDIKYVLKTSQLCRALAALGRQYWVLDIDGVRLHPYETLYFDTVDYALYLRHHAGRTLRYKVRSRQYVDSHRSFLEVKVKSNKDRTSKKRIETSGLLTWFTREASSFVSACVPLDADSLETKLWNGFSRVTLVGKHVPERLTLDVNLRFGNGQESVVLPGVAVAEVKQEGINRNSEFIRQMRAMAIHPTGFSKYCIGVAILCQEVKHNNFKAKLSLVERLIGEENNVYGTH